MVNRIMNTKQIVFLYNIFILFTVFLFSVFGSKFAKINIEISALNFPIFISEIILLLGIAIMVVFRRKNIRSTNLISYILYFYIVFFLFKAFYGYFIWGPLAFRNAALFYYVMFSVIVFNLFDTTNFSKLIGNKYFDYSYLALICILVFFNFIRIRYYFTYYIFTMIIISNFKKIYLRNILFIIFSCIFGYLIFRISKRSIIVGVSIASIFAIFTYLAYFVSVRFYYKLSALGLFLLFISLSFYGLGDKNALRSVLNLKTHFNKSLEWHKELKFKGKEFNRKNVPVRLYEKEKKDHKGLKKNDVLKYAKAESKKESQVKRKFRNMKVANANIIWRFLVILDMIEEYVENKKIFGIDFGHPFRSKSIEITGWHSGGLWVGWLEPHNSYLHIIYRAGIIGLASIVFVFMLFIKMVRICIIKKNIKGLLICSVLLYWFIIANFEVILELPQFAVFIWVIFGITYKYLRVEL